MPNPYFLRSNFPENNESKLYSDALNELIEIRGTDMFYMPRQRFKDDFIFGEDVAQQFTEAHPLTFYVQNYTYFDGKGDIFSKFGFTPDYQLTLFIGIQTFRGTTGLTTPMESDLIYWPTADRIFEIVGDHDKVDFFEFNNKEYAFKIYCKFFEYSHENIETDIPELDVLKNYADINNSYESTQFTDSDDILDLTESDIFGNL